MKNLIFILLLLRRSIFMQTTSPLSTEDHISCLTSNALRGSEAQKSESLYRIDSYKNPLSDASIIVSIRLIDSSDSNNIFRGFTISALSADTKTTIGLWKNATEEDLVLDENCTLADKGTFYTTKKEKQNVNIEWVPPADYSGSVYFNATVIKTPQVFWTSIISQPIILKNGKLHVEEILRNKREMEDDNEESKDVEIEVSTEAITEDLTTIATRSAKPIASSKIRSGLTPFTSRPPNKKNKKLWTTIKHGTTTRKTPVTRKLRVTATSTENPNYNNSTDGSITTSEEQKDGSKSKTPSNHANKELNEKSYLKSKSRIRIAKMDNSKNENSFNTENESTDYNETIESESRDIISKNNNNSNGDKFITKKQGSNLSTTRKTIESNTAKVLKNEEKDSTEIHSHQFKTQEKIIKATTRGMYKVNNKSGTQEHTLVSSNSHSASAKQITPRQNFPTFAVTIPKRTTIASRTIGKSNILPDLSTSQPQGVKHSITKNIIGKSKLLSKQDGNRFSLQSSKPEASDYLM